MTSQKIVRLLCAAILAVGICTDLGCTRHIKADPVPLSGTVARDTFAYREIKPNVYLVVVPAGSTEPAALKAAEKEIGCGVCTRIVTHQIYTVEHFPTRKEK